MHVTRMLLGLFFLTAMASMASDIPADMEAGYTTPKDAPKIAIVIDDIGYQIASSKRLAQMPYPITMAIIPSATHAQEAAELAVTHKQELILHVPMETHFESKWEDGLTTDMNRNALQTKLVRMLNQFPNIVGINNHGGSKLTEDQARMLWVSRVLSKRHLYFLDSRTTSASRVVSAARAFGVQHISRDVFLDNSRDPESIAAAFDRLRTIARQHGQAIAIGHPHPETLAQLSLQLPQLISEGFELSFGSQLLSDAPETYYSRGHVHYLR